MSWFEERVDLRGVLSAGAVIGKGACNAKWIGREAGGARLTVEDTYVIVTGRSRAVVSRAVQLLQAQLDANEQLVSPAYPHPLRIDYVLLEDAFGANPDVRFRYRADEAARATGRPNKLFELSPARDSSNISSSGGGGGGAYADEADSLAALLAGASLRPSRAAPAAAAAGKAASGGEGARFHAAAAGALRGSVARALSDAARIAAANTPSFDVLKLRFNLGKQFFSDQGEFEKRSAIPLSELQALSPDAMFKKSTYSNCVPTSTVPRVVSRLSQRMGFTLVDTKTTATLHVIDQALNVHYAVGLSLSSHGDGPGGVTLRKVKSSSSRCHFAALLGGPEQLDMRIKLIGQRDLQDSRAQAAADHIVAACNRVGYAVATSSSSSGGYLPANMRLELARRKTKQVYEGEHRTASGNLLRMRLSLLTVEDKDGRRNEITGTLPDVDQELSRLLGEAVPAGTSRSGGGSSPASRRAAAAGTTTTSSAGGDPLPCGAEWAGDVLSALAEFMAELNAA
ncbi:hypothetical protein Agub_g6542, partial [Astrephomene gubernaculifera]